MAARSRPVLLREEKNLADLLGRRSDRGRAGRGALAENRKRAKAEGSLVQRRPRDCRDRAMGHFARRIVRRKRQSRQGRRKLDGILSGERSPRLQLVTLGLTGAGLAR